MNELLFQANNFLSGLQIPWAVCGGFALDLFLGKEVRRHSDIDICVFEIDRDCVSGYMLNNGWNIYEFRGQGKVRALDSKSSSEFGRNLMCIKDDCDIVKFFPCEDTDMLYHEFHHTGITKLNYLEFLFNTMDDDNFIFNRELDIKREISKSILFYNGIPYLSPELVLLFKSSKPDNKEYQFDFDETFPNMNDEQKLWFIQSMNVLYPNGHMWKL